MVKDPEGDMMKLMKYVDENPYIFVVHQDTRKVIHEIIEDYTPRFAEYGRILTNLHRKSKKDTPAWEEVR